MLPKHECIRFFITMHIQVLLLFIFVTLKGVLSLFQSILINIIFILSIHICICQQINFRKRSVWPLRSGTMKKIQKKFIHIFGLEPQLNSNYGFLLDFTILSRPHGTSTIKLHVHQTCGSLGLGIHCLFGVLSGLSAGRWYAEQFSLHRYSCLLYLTCPLVYTIKRLALFLTNSIPTESIQ